MFLFTYGASLRAAEITIRSDELNPLVGESFQVDVEVSGADTNHRQPIPPATNDFRFDHIGTSSNLSIINGTTNRSFQHSFLVTALKKGRFELGPFIYAINNQNIKSNVLVVSVREESPSEAAFFAKSMTNRQEAFVGQQLVYTLKFYFRVNITDVRLSEPEFEAFWSEDLEQSRPQTEIVNGISYNVYTIRQALYPKRAGKLRIEPATLSFQVIKQTDGRGNTTFDDLFFNSPFSGRRFRKQASVSTEPMAIVSLPLPSENQPKNFSGLVGEVDVELGNVRNLNLTQGQSFTLGTNIIGTANLALDFNIEWPNNEDFKVYADEPEVSKSFVGQNQNKRLSLRKNFNTAIVPLKSGQLELPAIKVSYFDPSSKTYKVASSTATRLNVAPGQLTQDLQLPATPTSSTGKIRVVGDDILPNHMGSTIYRQQGMRLFNGETWLFVLLPILWMLISLILRKLIYQNPKVAARGRQRKAANKAQALLKTIETHSDPFDALHSIYCDFLRDRCHCPNGLLSEDDVIDSLTELKVSDEKAKKAATLLSSLEALKHRPQGSNITTSNDTIQSTVGDLKQTIRTIDREASS